MVGAEAMVVRQYHHKQIRFLLLLEIIFVYFLISSLFLIPVHSGFTVIIILYVLSQTCILYTFAFELRAYIVCNNGICIKWFGVYNYLINWAEVKYIGYELVGERGIEHKSIIVSKIPLKKIDILPFGANASHSNVDYDWLAFRPHKVVAIYLEDLKEGQLEEFWSYVPERLKKDSQKRGLYSKENCC